MAVALLFSETVIIIDLLAAPSFCDEHFHK